MMPVLTILLSGLSSAFAAQVSIEADTPTFSEGQSVGLVLTVTDTSVRGGPPRFPVPDGLTAEFESQQQQQLMLNMNLTTSTIYRYTLTALKSGDFVIPPLPVLTAAGVLQTQSLSLHVEARGASTGGVNELTGELSDAAHWVGQMVVYHLRFATDRQLQNGQWVPPEGKGFTIEPGIEPVNSTYTVGEGGTSVGVRDLYLPMRFTQAGEVSIPGGALQAQFAVERSRRRRGQMEQLFPDLGMFQDVRSEMFSAPTLHTTIKDPPKAGRPADWTGLVGEFTLTSHVTGAAVAGPVKVNVGDTVTVAVDLVGDSPVSGVKLPPLVGDGFKVYDDQPVATGTIQQGKVVATSSFKRAIVPQRPGPLTIPSIDLPVFDPAKGEYVTLHSDPVELEVGGSAASAQVASFSSGGAPQGPIGAGDELLPIRPAPSTIPRWSGRYAWLLLLPGALGLVFKGGRGLLVRRLSRAATTRAFGFEDLPTDPHERLSGLELIFREAVAPRLGIGAAAVHGEDLVRLGDVAAEAEVVYRLLERARYADGGGGGSTRAVEALEQALRAFVKKLR